MSGKAAEHPFFVEAVTTNLYTVEELCYYLYHNPCLIDEDIVSTKLTRWIAEELHLGETALRMEQAMSERSTLADFILPVFQEIRYLSPQETKEYMRQLETLSSGPAWTRLKERAMPLRRTGSIRPRTESTMKRSEEYQRAPIPRKRGCSWRISGTI
jgi:hypothetical protein